MGIGGIIGTQRPILGFEKVVWSWVLERVLQRFFSPYSLHILAGGVSRDFKLVLKWGGQETISEKSRQVWFDWYVNTYPLLDVQMRIREALISFLQH